MSEKNRKAALSPWMKGFLTSILGTTISIALTFGTTALINAQKKKAAQKQTAMMVIHDINTTIESLEYSRDQYEKNYQSAQYFLENMDRPEEADPEKLSEAIDASLKLLFHSDQEASLNDATEKIFTSGMDAWSNLDNMSFIENVQYFYYRRRSWLDYTNSSIYWRGPLNESEIVAQLAGQDYTKSRSLWDTWGEFLKNKMKDKTIRYFLDITPNRIRQINELIQTLSDLNEENMFLMNITDDELERFVTQLENKKSPLNERDLVGTWINSQSVGNSMTSEVEFFPNHSFEARDTTSYSSWHFRGKIKVAVSIGGKWEIKKDSLLRYYDKETLQTEIDSSSISFSEDMKEATERYMQSLHKYYEQDMVQYFETNNRSARRGSFDLARKKMELTTTVTDENGAQTEQSLHYKRK